MVRDSEHWLNVGYLSGPCSTLRYDVDTKSHSLHRRLKPSRHGLFLFTRYYACLTIHLRSRQSDYLRSFKISSFQRWELRIASFSLPFTLSSPSGTSFFSIDVQATMLRNPGLFL
jgi:hypothetical protein